MPRLITWYDYYELKIPNKTNAIDGHFADLKNKLQNHNGLSLVREKKFTDEFLRHKVLEKYQRKLETVSFE